MRIYLQPPHPSGSVDQSVRIAHQLLHNFHIASARPAGIVNEQGVILIEAHDIMKALDLLREAGLRAVVG